jgi:signal transduction histidine kinase
VGAGNLVLTLGLLPIGVLLVLDPANHGGPLAAVLLSLAVTTLLAVRRAPTVAAWVAAGLVLATQLLTGPLVTCGVMVPVMCAMSFQLAARSVGPRLVAGAAGVLVTAGVEVVLDPVLGASGGVFIAGLLLGFAFAGFLLRSRAAAVEALRQRTVELSRQRDRTAELAVAADRERIGTDLETAIGTRIRTISVSAVIGRGTMRDGPPEAALAALEHVELEGRETLASMREVVGTMRDAPTTPLPGLGDLDTLLSRATAADARLTVVGATPVLGPHVELCAYRIVEQLLVTLSDLPRAQVDVVVRFDEGALRISMGGPQAVSGTPEREAMVAAALDAARERAAVAGGRLVTSSPRGWRRIDVVLPVPSVVR